MKLFDTHVHLFKENYKNENITKIIEEQLKKVDPLFLVAYNEETIHEVLFLSKKFSKKVFAIIGIHPNNSIEWSHDIKNLIIKNKTNIIAIGETGLDFFHKKDIEFQENSFKQQIELAQELDLPVIVHCREAMKETVKIINKYSNVTFVMHSFSGGADDIKLFGDNVFFSFSGMITYKNAINIQNAVINISVDKIIMETDSPWLSPEPNRGKKNIPENTTHILKKLAELKNIEPDKLLKIMHKTLKNIFKI